MDGHVISVSQVQGLSLVPVPSCCLYDKKRKNVPEARDMSLSWAPAHVSLIPALLVVVVVVAIVSRDSVKQGSV